MCCNNIRPNSILVPVIESILWTQSSNDLRPALFESHSNHARLFSTFMLFYVHVGLGKDRQDSETRSHLHKSLLIYAKPKPKRRHLLCS